MTRVNTRSRPANRLRPCVESLESRTVLSGAPMAQVLVANPPQEPLIPLKTSFVPVTTDRAVYRIGQPVTITITETNTSNHDIQVLTGCQILHATVTKGGATVWRFIDARECPTGLGVLHAHQSRHFTLIWNGKFNIPNLPPGISHTGTFVIHAGVDGVSGSATIVIKKP
jgi:uncharacterized repeat protein (TIGR01451 family)